jgi:hypothetical protein
MVMALLATAWGGDGVVNDMGEVWQVRYHKSQPSETTKDVAIRFHVKESGGKLIGTLTRYDAVDFAKKKYVQRKGKSGKVTDIEGTITKAGNGKNRQRQKFEFKKDYAGDDGKMRVLTIKGFHHGGKGKDDEADDWICIRVFDKEAGMITASKLVDMCDDQPPDEDNLDEESDTPDPPDYDGDGG